MDRTSQYAINKALNARYVNVKMDTNAEQKEKEGVTNLSVTRTMVRMGLRATGSVTSAT